MIKKKRAQTTTLRWLIELGGGIVIGFFFSFFLISAAKGQSITKDHYAKDLALQLNTLYSIPGNAYFINSAHLDKYTISFSNEFVEVYQLEKDPTQGKYPYVRTSDSKLDVIFDKPKQLVLVKDGGQIKIQETIPEFSRSTCPDVNTKDLNWRTNKKIIIDPGHGYESGKEVEESKITTNIVSSLTVHLIDANYKLTRDGNYDLSVNDRLETIKNENPDTIISINIGSYSEDKNIVYAYVPKNSDKERENWKLACLIRNKFKEKFDVETKIIREDINKLDINDPKQVLKFPGKVSVMLEISNIQTEEGKEMLKSIVEISNSIYDGIEAYYTK